MGSLRKGLFILLILSAISLSATEQVNYGINQQFLPQVSDQKATQEGEFYRLTLMTVGPGIPLMELYSWWGHIALIVEDTREPEGTVKRSTIYDYGIFSIAEDKLIFNFLRGRIDYLVAGSPGYYREFLIDRHIYENRWVVEQPLNLEPAAAYRIAKYLENNTKPGNDNYPYHFYYENCCTKIRDLIDFGVNGQLKERTSIRADKNLRVMSRQYLAKSFLADWGLMFLLGEKVVDQECTQWDHLFLPYELMMTIQNFQYRDQFGQKQFLVKQSQVEEHIPPQLKVKMQEQGEESFFNIRPEGIQQKTPLTWLLGLCFGIVVGSIGALLFLFGTKHRAIRITGGIYLAVVVLLLFVLGLILFIMVFFSNHDVTKMNWNLILINPLTMAIAFILSILYAADIGKSKIAYGWYWLIMAALSVALAVAKIIGLYKQENLMILSALLPLFVLMAITAIFKNRLNFKGKEKRGA